MNSSKKKLFCIIYFLLSFTFTSLLAETVNIKKGEVLYEKHCAECHSLSLRGSAHGNELIGSIFLEKWQNDFELLYSIIAETMPPGNNHKITDNEYMDIFSYILARNNVENINLKNIAAINNDETDWVSFSDPSTIDRPEDRKSLFENKKLSEFIDLSIQDINYPNANDWTSWRRTPLSHGYTPLTNITKKNINDLKLKQKLMLEKAPKLLKDGGHIIYCVCSIIFSEGEGQIQKFLQNFKNFSLINCFSSIESFGMKSNNLPYFFTTPDLSSEQGGIDGFFIACLKKNY